MHCSFTVLELRRLLEKLHTGTGKSEIQGKACKTQDTGLLDYSGKKGVDEDILYG